MSKKTKSQRATEKTLRAARQVSRRSLLKSAAVAGAVAGMGPWYIKKTMAAAELNVMMWSDYLPQEFLDAFKEETGITINHTGIGSNEEILNKMKATKGRGFDLISPTGMRALQWEPLGVLQPFDMDRIPTDRLTPSMLAVGYDDLDFGGKGSHWVPQLWGTEA
ncbi:MAG TPA: twin-arginine translocation signal domain-containing protein, partial [Kiloniellaceae bacterium]|nr:twin-arginine translocation signal domain-containing protein [Kiloniellaceae bacterium]